MIRISGTRSDGMRNRRLIAHHGCLFLIKITFPQTVCPLPAYIPARAVILFRQQEIHMPGEPGTSRQIHHAAPSFLRMFLRDDINNTHIAVCIMFGRRRCNDLYILDMSGRYLFQGLRSGKDTGLSIYINQKAGASPEGNFAFCVHPNRRGVLQNIYSRTATAHHIR